MVWGVGWQACQPALISRRWEMILSQAVYCMRGKRRTSVYTSVGFSCIGSISIVQEVLTTVVPKTGQRETGIDIPARFLYDPHRVLFICAHIPSGFQPTRHWEVPLKPGTPNPRYLLTIYVHEMPGPIFLSPNNREPDQAPTRLNEPSRTNDAQTTKKAAVEKTAMRNRTSSCQTRRTIGSRKPTTPVTVHHRLHDDDYHNSHRRKPWHHHM